MLTVNFLFIGCTHIFLQPDKRLHVNPDQVGAQWKDVQFKSLDGTQLTGLWFPSKYNTPKGTVIQFHGNGENMTSHFLYVYWLALEGWNVLSFDYRGYGASHGNKSLKGSVQDGVAAIQYAREKSRGLPLCIIAQSLGGTLAITSLHRDGGQDVRAIILDSTFASFQRMAQDKLSHWWLTWALQWPLAHALISDHLAVEKILRERKSIPLLVIHGENDPVVPLFEGKHVYELARDPKEFWLIPGNGHTQALGELGAEFRPKIEAFLNRSIAN